jgi:hypothetical protein
MGMIPSTSARFERCDREPLDNALVEPSGTTQYQLHESQAKRYSSSEKKKKPSPFDPFKKTQGRREIKRCGAPDTSSKGCIKTKKKTPMFRCSLLMVTRGPQSQPVDVI